MEQVLKYSERGGMDPFESKTHHVKFNQQSGLNKIFQVVTSSRDTYWPQINI